ncbi:rhomboid family intramembrane serine protease [Candidatus Omnitrophota bacterium]
MSKAIKGIIIANLGVFLLMSLVSRLDLYYFALVPSLFIRRFMVWQVVTYMFIHAGLWHLAINMLMLWFFGPALEYRWGTKQFLFYYFICGIGAGLCSVLFSLNSVLPIVGASGAIFGILVAFALNFPDSQIQLFFIFPMKMRYAVGVLAAINLFGAVSASGGSIAYIAHLGGGLSGYLYLRSEWLKFKLSGISLSRLGSWQKKKKTQLQQKQRQDLEQEVDRILDKIAKQGIQSLTRGEKKILEEKSRQK